MLRLSRTAIAHALIILPWLSFKTELTQLDQPKCLYGETLVKQAGSGHPLSFVCGWVAVCRADLSPVVSWSSIEKSGFSPFCSPPSHHPSRSLLSRFSRSTRVDCEQSPFFLRFSEAIFVSRAFRSRDLEKRETARSLTACASRIQAESGLVPSPLFALLKSPSPSFRTPAIHSTYDEVPLKFFFWNYLHSKNKITRTRHEDSTLDIGLIIRHARFCGASIFNLHGLCQPVISLSDCREGLQEIQLFR